MEYRKDDQRKDTTAMLRLKTVQHQCPIKQTLINTDRVHLKSAMLRVETQFTWVPISWSALSVNTTSTNIKMQQDDEGTSQDPQPKHF